ncbi:hypothetical protein MKK68_03185 [Methylobacterium sp. E-016]|jgi:predicted metal-dependent phosphoesterase TrpH|uniref:hypothetical protein n=1 Tax=Methylobacterium sp. E-016 TaxID=2836556 RepID=UPI001FBC01CE|nr:hypothetical protein [Methylobacterium sp. E-016]MCJ2074658.1 hypothetical protein [Methylobacterium sp. E-016]
MDGPPIDYPADTAAEVIAAAVVVRLHLIEFVSSVSLGRLADRVRDVARRGVEVHARYGAPLPTMVDLEAAAHPTQEISATGNTGAPCRRGSAIWPMRR